MGAVSDREPPLANCDDLAAWGAAAHPNRGERLVVNGRASNGDEVGYCGSDGVYRLRNSAGATLHVFFCLVSTQLSTVESI